MVNIIIIHSSANEKNIFWAWNEINSAIFVFLTESWFSLFSYLFADWLEKKKKSFRNSNLFVSLTFFFILFLK